uniref:SMP-30/Gluconolactonase/LRE-like region domain-containing protein n=1 Tax=Amorphochlora amoebiformis TaxID=1561963 RepID=A0A7S0GQD9_9EUKA|mmetsp:Transcript_11932/g.18969  ORF Transcript_11932/g.18969 Transcript_11932/m.18969 type:complete len:637 (+) Transcript_11932:205-2115(+)
MLRFVLFLVHTSPSTHAGHPIRRLVRTRPSSHCRDISGVFRLRGGAEKLEETVRAKRKAPTTGVHIGPRLYNVTTFAGTWYSDNHDGAATRAGFVMPSGLAFGPDGCMYISDVADNRIRKITPNGRTVQFAGRGDIREAYLPEDGTQEVIYDDDGIVYVDCFADGYSYDAKFNRPQAIAINSKGWVYVADVGNRAIRVIKPSKFDMWPVKIFAGADKRGIYLPRNQSSLLSNPIDILVDREDNVYVADSDAAKVRKYSMLGDDIGNYGKILQNMTEDYYARAKDGFLPGQDGYMARTPEDAEAMARGEINSSVVHPDVYWRLFNASSHPNITEIFASPTAGPTRPRKPYIHELWKPSRKKEEEDEGGAPDIIEIEATLPPTSPPTDTEFYPSPSFRGRKIGFFFQNGPLGVGYYPDEGGVPKGRMPQQGVPQGRRHVEEGLAWESQPGEWDDIEEMRRADKEAKAAIEYLERTGKIPEYLIPEPSTPSEEPPFDERYEEERKKRDPLGVFPDFNRLNSRKGATKQLRDILMAERPLGGHRDGPLSVAKFQYPRALAMNSKGVIYVADPPYLFDGRYHWIRTISPDGIVNTFAGGISGYQDGKASNARFFGLTSMTFDRNDTLPHSPTIWRSQWSSD